MVLQNHGAMQKGALCCSMERARGASHAVRPRDTPLESYGPSDRGVVNAHAFTQDPHPRGLPLCTGRWKRAKNTMLRCSAWRLVAVAQRSGSAASCFAAAASVSRGNTPAFSHASQPAMPAPAMGTTGGSSMSMYVWSCTSHSGTGVQYTDGSVSIGWHLGYSVLQGPALSPAWLVMGLHTSEAKPETNRSLRENLRSIGSMPRGWNNLSLAVCAKLQSCSSSAFLSTDTLPHSCCPALTTHQQGAEERHIAAWHSSHAGAVIRLQRTAVARVLRARCVSGHDSWAGFWCRVLEQGRFVGSSGRFQDLAPGEFFR